MSALIGYTGFVGGTLARQRPFDTFFRSTNIDELRGQTHDLVVCAGAPGQKWRANREPEADRAQLRRLMEALDGVRAETVVLLSTVDVFSQPVGVTEETPVNEVGLQPYGLHRRELEKFVEQRFPRHVVVRLAGLVGPGLRKNVIYDFAHDNNVDQVDSRAVFQFYPTVNLWSDVATALREGLKLVHLTGAPVSVREIASEGFGRDFDNVPAELASREPVRYDFRSLHAARFGGTGAYQYSHRECMLAVRAYAQSVAVASAGAGA